MAKMKLKRGDDFKLEMTVTDKKNALAVSTKALLDAALTANPQVPQDIANATVAYNNAIRVDITGWTIISHIRGANGKLIKALDVVIVDAAEGIFTLAATALETAKWSPDTYKADIQFDRPSFGKVSSQTFTITVEEDYSYE